MACSVRGTSPPKTALSEGHESTHASTFGEGNKSMHSSALGAGHELTFN